jgi:hypothetical protein
MQEVQGVLVEKLTALHAELNGRDDRLAGTLAQLGALCSDVAERLEADRGERRELVQTIAALASAVIAKGDPPEIEPNDRVIGGTVYGAAPASPYSDTIDLPTEENVGAGNGHVDDLHVMPGTYVRCRFGRRWVDGFEVEDVVEGGGVTRYRVRRRSDRSVLHKLFDADDLRAGSRPAARADADRTPPTDAADWPS